MSYERKLHIGGTITISRDAISGNPETDSYTFEKEHEGAIYRWTGMRPATITEEAVTFELPEQPVSKGELHEPE